MSSSKHIAIVIPALNEEDALPPLLAEIPPEFASRVIVVDNGSTDATATVAQAVGVTVASEPRRGYGRACLTGLETAVQMGADIVVYMDGDGSDDPADLPMMLAPLLAHQADFVIGSRIGPRAEQGAVPVQARLGNWLVSSILRLRYAVPIHDIGSFRALRVADLLALDMSEMTFGWPVEMVVKAARAHYRIREQPIHYRRRSHGRSKVAGTITGSIKAAYLMLRVTFRAVLSPPAKRALTTAKHTSIS